MEMQNRYERVFAGLRARKEKAFIPFVTIGDPDYNTSLKTVKALAREADALELGLAFSDPIADGKTIQAADVRALEKGITTSKVFKLIREVRKSNAEIPIGLLVYYNLIYSRGLEKFYRQAKRAGVDGILVADMPMEEAAELLRISKKTGINQIFLISPTTSKARMKKILKLASGFVYVVSLLGVTGARKRIQSDTIKLVRRVRPLTKLPVCVGFGISKPEHVKAVCRAGADGAIAGSAVVRLIEKNLSNKRLMLKRVKAFARKMKKATL